MQYKSKMADEADLRRRLASLEESVELHEHMKRQVTHCCWAPQGLHLAWLCLLRLSLVHFLSHAIIFMSYCVVDLQKAYNELFKFHLSRMASNNHLCNVLPVIM